MIVFLEKVEMHVKNENKFIKMLNFKKSTYCTIRFMACTYLYNYTKQNRDL